MHNEGRGRPLIQAALSFDDVESRLSHSESSMGLGRCQEPVALAVHKRGRWVVVGKVVPLDGEPVLAVCWRNQQGTCQAVSVPLAAVAFAETHGAERFLLRDDRSGTMRDIGLDDMRKQGWIGQDGELYIKLDAMRPVPWASWPYAERVVRLGQEAEPEPVAVQAALL